MTQYLLNIKPRSHGFNWASLSDMSKRNNATTTGGFSEDRGRKLTKAIFWASILLMTKVDKDIRREITEELLHRKRYYFLGLGS